MTKYLSTKISNAGLVCACLVVLLHSPIGTRPQSLLWWCNRMGPDGIGYVAVPMFFAISGWFLAGHIGERGWWKREVCKRVSSLLVPMFVWCGLWYGCELALGLKSFTFPSRPVFGGLVRFSFPIYVLHMVVYKAFDAMVPGGSLLRLAVMTACAFVLPCVIAAACQAYAPALGGMLFGGRCTRREIK